MQKNKIKILVKKLINGLIWADLNEDEFSVRWRSRDNSKKMLSNGRKIQRFKIFSGYSEKLVCILRKS